MDQNSSPTSVNAETLVAPLAATMPDVTVQIPDSSANAPAANVPQAPAAPETPPPVASTLPPVVLRDRKHTKFSPGYHASHPDGTPKLDRNGRFYAANKGRPKKDRMIDPAQTTPPAGSPEEKPTFATIDGGSPVNTGDEFAAGAVEDRFSAMADAYLQLAYAPMVAYFGTDVTPDENEHAALKMPTSDLLRRAQAKDLHPGIVLAAVASGIFMTKLRKPTVRERFDSLVGKVKAWFARKPAIPKA